MAEYYPLLAKAVGSLPNSSPETRRVVYERARKALIGQLRTMHPPIPDEDIDRESVELDRAIERVETELAAAPAADLPASAPPAAAAPVVEAPAAPPPPAPSSPAPSSPAPLSPPGPIGSLSPTARKPIAPLRPPVARPPRPVPATVDAASAPGPAAAPVPPVVDPSPADRAETAKDVTPAAIQDAVADGEAESPRPRLEAQRPIAPMPPTARGPKRPIWILPVVVAIVVLAVGLAAWKLRVRPETMARNAPAAQPQQADNGKIADRVGGAQSPGETAGAPAQTPSEAPAETPAQSPASATNPAPADQPAAPPTQTAKQETNPPPPINPAVPVAYRAALLVEAPDLPSKVQTFPGTVVWKLNNVNAGPSDAVGLSVEASIDLPQDKMKATVVFERNVDPSLPASHTIKVRFTIDPGSYSGDIKQISVPQMRREGNSDGEPLAGVTVPVVQNSFLVGLSPGNAETANLRLIGDLPWVDVPILLSSGRIAKLTFEKGAAGQRDIAEALSYWQKP